MGSSRSTWPATSEDVKTYDSAGGKDYSALATWEAATDINCVTGTTSPVLEVYAGDHDDADTLNGATTSSSYFRIVRAASGEGHSGIPKFDGSVAAFDNISSNQTTLAVDEDYGQLQDLVLSSHLNENANRYTSGVLGSDRTNVACIGLLCVDSTNTYAGREGRGMLVYPCDFIAVNCLMHNIETDGALCLGTGDTSTTSYLYNCTIDSNNDDGIQESWISPDNLTIKNCIIANNTGDRISGADYTETTGSSTATYVASGSDDFHLDSSDTTNRGNGTDLSADAFFAFDDDIDGDTRSAWDIGFDEYVSGAITGSGAGTLTPAGAFSRGLKAGRSYGGTL